MKNSTSSHLIILIVMTFFFGACSVGGEVVKVTTVQEGFYAGLKKEDIANLDEIKRARVDKNIDSNLRTVIEETKHFSVAQYLLEHPEARGSAGGDYRVGGYDVLSKRSLQGSSEGIGGWIHFISLNRGYQGR